MEKMSSYNTADKLGKKPPKLLITHTALGCVRLVPENGPSLSERCP